MNRLHTVKKMNLIIQVFSLHVNIYEEMGNTEIAFFPLLFIQGCFPELSVMMKIFYICAI